MLILEVTYPDGAVEHYLKKAFEEIDEHIAIANQYYPGCIFRVTAEP